MMDEIVMPEITAAPATGAILAKASLIAAAANTAASVFPSGAEPVTLEEAKAHLRVIGTDEDGNITDLIVAAREMAEGRLNRTITQRQRTEVFASWRDGLVLLKPPIISVDAVTYADDAGEVQTLDPVFYYLSPSANAPAEIDLAPGFQQPALHFRRNPIAVTYTAGYPEGDVPRAICSWMLLALGALYQNRESLVTGISVTALPNDFMALLIQPYRVYE